VGRCAQPVKAMKKLGFTTKELITIIQACSSIAIDDCTPPYLQDFIASRLADAHPKLSTKVRRLSADQMDELCEHIKENQTPVA
jgi:hypothetical protein